MLKVLDMMMTPKYRTDLKACSCLGYWYRRTCKHYRAYGEAMALVMAQNAANLTLGTAQGSNRAVRGSQGDNHTGQGEHHR